LRTDQPDFEVHQYFKNSNYFLQLEWCAFISYRLISYLIW